MKKALAAVVAKRREHERAPVPRKKAIGNTCPRWRRKMFLIGKNLFIKAP
jgi:hypothetical protein